MIELKPGRYEYRYVVDGNWCNEQKPCEESPNPFGATNSVLEIK